MASDRSITPEPDAGSGAAPDAPSPADGEGGAHAPREGYRGAPGAHGTARHGPRAHVRAAGSEAEAPSATRKPTATEAPADGGAQEPTGGAAPAGAQGLTDEAATPQAQEPTGARDEPTREAGASDEPTREAGALEELAAKAAKADEYLALAQRTKADFDNFRRRAAREAAAAQERGAVRLALELLPAIDNLERALAHAESESGGNCCGDDSFVAGIRHVHADVIAALGRAGIECYSPDGERFDPQLHEAVAQQPTEGAEPGVIVEVYQRGYRIGDSVVRPARVVVAG